MDMTTRPLLDRFSIEYSLLEQQRAEMDTLYYDIAKYLKPIYAERFLGDVGRINSDDFGSFIFDGDPIAAKNRMVDGLFGWLVSPAIDWLRFESLKYKDSREAQLYIEGLMHEINYILNQSNFYDTIHEALDNGISFGTEGVDVTYDENTNRIFFDNMPISDMVISENKSGIVDVVYKKKYMTVRQVIETFGFIDELKDIEKEKLVKVLHVMYPRTYQKDIALKPASKKPFGSVYLYCGVGSTGKFTPIKILKESGFNYKHFVVWRYKKIAGYSYGISPAMDALFDIKSLNLQSKGLLDAVQLMTHPPLLADIGLKGRLKIAPKAISYRTNPQDTISPMLTAGNYPVATTEIERRSRIIREHFRTDFFMSISQIQGTSRQRTATEVMELKAESAAVLGSVVGRIQSELLEPILVNVLRIAIENNLVTMPPKGLEDIDLNLNFIGPLAQAQKKYLVKQGIEQGLQSAFSIARVNPNVLHNYNLDYAARELSKVDGYPEAGFFDKGVVENIRKQLNQQQQMMQQQMMQQQQGGQNGTTQQ